MWYVAFASTILFLVAVAMAIALVRPQYVKKLLGHHPHKKQVILVGLPLLLLSVSGIAFGTWLHARSQTAAKTSQTVDDPNRVLIQQKVAATDTLPAYELLSQTTKGKDMRVTVVVGTKDKTKLTLLNNKLIAQYKTKAAKTTLYIDYFDDRQAAKDYFAKIADKKISQTDRTNLAKHYVAIATYSAQLGPQFVIVPDVGSLLKK